MFIIIRHATEISLKSDTVRKKFLSRLVSNLRCALDQNRIEYALTEGASRLYLETDEERALDVLSRVFGISSFSLIEYRSDPTREDMLKTILAYTQAVTDKSFCVRVKRFHVPSFTSPELERVLGAALYPYAAKVNLKNPDVKINIELRKDGAYFYSKLIKGAGGLPLGIEGRALCLMSGGFDSPVAAWMMLKRGVALDFLFFNLAGSAYLNSTVNVTKALVERWCYGSKSNFYTIDFTPITKEITATIESRFPQVVLKRMMYRVATNFASKLRGISALVTGESIGQVSSQTLHNLAAINPASSLMVLRPLLCFDKEEIINLSYKIGTGLQSAQIKEYCQISTAKPATRSSIAKATQQEALLDPNLVLQAVAGATRINIMDRDHTNNAIMDDLYTDHLSTDTVVIDCRPAQLFHLWHYPGALSIEFADLLERFHGFDKTKRFVLYCPYGTQTALLAEKMRASGFDAASFRGGSKALKNYHDQHQIESL